MPETTTSSQLLCTQCGGELHPEEGQVFLTCPYCNATIFLDKSKVVLHWFLTPTLDEGQAQQALARWMSGNATVKDLDQKSQVVGKSFTYFPLWYFKNKVAGEEKMTLQPAAATSISELTHLNLPAGDLRSYDAQLDPAMVSQPTVPLEAAVDWQKQANPGGEILESALVHVPVYTFKYSYKNRIFTAVVEAATGQVSANIFPAKAEAPYLLAGGITIVVYLCLALIPIFSSSAGSAGGLAGAGTALMLGALAAPFLFAFAVWVASKV
jgi:hypothetical protein